MNLIFYNVVLNSMLKYVTITVKVTDRCNVYITFSQNFNLATGNNIRQFHCMFMSHACCHDSAVII